MQLSAPSSSLEINSVASADRAALASSAAGAADGETNGGDFAALVSNFSAAPAAATVPSATIVTAPKPGATKPGSAPWSGGARRGGFGFGPPSERSAAKTTDASDPLTALALAGVLPVAPAQADTALPTLELPEAASPGLPTGETEGFDFAANPSAGLDEAPPSAAGSAPTAIPAGLLAADLQPSTPSAGESRVTAGFGFPEAKGTPSDRTKGVARADDGPRSASPMTTADAVAGQGEKIAEAGVPFEREGGPRERGADKKIQTALDKRVAEHPINLGTDVAKPASVMSTTSLSRQAAADSASVTVTGASAAQDPLPPAPESAVVTASQAHRAVEAVMTAADRVGAGEKQAVNLQFSFLDVSLAVRVELREGAVHTTFRTDSTELRSALAHEWQAVSAQASDRPVKMADPVFAGSHGGSSANSFAGDNARQQQQQQQQRDSLARSGLDFLSAAASRPAGRSSASAAVDVAAPVGFTRRSTTTHLETFA